MFKKLIEAIVIWIVVAIVVYLVGSLLLVTNMEVIDNIGDFLIDTSGLIGFLCGVVHFFFGTQSLKR